MTIQKDLEKYLASGVSLLYLISDEEQQELAAVESPETKDVQEVPPLSIPDYVHELVTRARQAAGRFARSRPTPPGSGSASAGGGKYPTRI